MMKGRQYDRRFFSRGIQPHVYAIAESGHTDKDGKKHKNYDEYALEYFCNGDAKRKALWKPSSVNCMMQRNTALF